MSRSVYEAITMIFISYLWSLSQGQCHLIYVQIEQSGRLTISDNLDNYNTTNTPLTPQTSIPPKALTHKWLPSILDKIIVS